MCNKLSLVALFLFMIHVGGAGAAPLCEFLLPSGTVVTISTPEQKLRGLQPTDVAALLQKTNELLVPEFIVPTFLDVRIAPAGFQAQCLLGATLNLMFVNSVHTSLDGCLENTLSNGEAVIVHEYTHVFYAMNIQRDLVAVLERFKNLQHQVMLDGKHSERLKSMVHMLQVYKEFFADFVALLVLRDPKVMRHTMHFPGEKDPDLARAALARDYSVLYDPTTWTELHPNLLLTPAGAFLWNTYLTKDSDLVTRQVFLRVLYLAIVSEIQSREESGNQEATVPEMNLKLIEIFKREMTKYSKKNNGSMSQK